MSQSAPDTERDALDLYLAEFTGAPGQRVSYLEAAIRDARAARHGSPPALWLASIGYLIAVEQIGHTVSLAATSAAPRAGSRAAFLAAIGDFVGGGLNAADADVLYSVRCELAHKYGLTNVPPYGNQEPLLFAYTSGGPLVSFRQVPWDGTVAGMSMASTTVVNLHAICDLVEDLVSTVRDLHAAGDVVLVAGITPAEIAGMLTFRSY